jgi:hypothetical protein
MSLSQKFKDVVSGPAVSVSSLYRDMRYPVRQAKRVETRYGMRVLMALSEEGGNTIEVFPPKRYGDAIEDTDMDDIKTKRLQYHLTYKGKSSASQALNVQIDL